jgi:peptidoglycan/xylan/chitin deacetylase (PgdA/CDA1 family)
MKLLVRTSGYLACQLHRLTGGRFLSSKMPFRIVYYHLVANENPLHYFAHKGVSIEDFKRQIIFFKRRYKIITLNEAYHMVLNGESINGCLAISTDDGFSENYTHITPMLVDEGLKATLFLTVNLLDNKELMWRNKLAYIVNTQKEYEIFKSMQLLAKEHKLTMPQSPAELMNWSRLHFPMIMKDQLCTQLWNSLLNISLDEYMATKQPYLSSSQVAELVGHGFEIGAHSLTHPYFDRLTYPEVVTESIGSIQSLEKMFNVPVRFFSYPFGVRCKPEFERALLNEYGDKLKSLIGIKNRLKNDATMNWDRDNQETDYYSAMFRFLVLPYIRRLQSTQ